MGGGEGQTNSLRHTEAHFVNLAMSALLITGHECNVEERNVRRDLQPKCQCFTLPRRERERERETVGRGKWNLDAFINHKRRSHCCHCRSASGNEVSGGETERRRDRRRVCSCSVVTKSRLLFIFGVRVSAAPAHQVRERQRRSEGGRKGVGRRKRKEASKHSVLLAFLARRLHSKQTYLRHRRVPPNSACLPHPPAPVLPLPRRLSVRTPSAYISLACVKKKKNGFVGLSRSAAGGK